MYQEDVETEKILEIKRNEKPIEIKDSMGRVVERKFINLKKRRPNPNRRPIKRQPLRRKKSFTDQFVY